MAQVGADGARTEVAALSDDAVAQVREVADLAAAHYGAVLDLHGVSHPDIIPQAGAGPDVAVGPDIAVLSDDYRAHDVGSGADDGAPADGHPPLIVAPGSTSPWTRGSTSWSRISLAARMSQGRPISSQLLRGTIRMFSLAASGSGHRSARTRRADSGQCPQASKMLFSKR